jgi:hypothetical protein
MSTVLKFKRIGVIQNPTPSPTASSWHEEHSSSSSSSSSSSHAHAHFASSSASYTTSSHHTTTYHASSSTSAASPTAAAAPPPPAPPAATVPARTVSLAPPAAPAPPSSSRTRPSAVDSPRTVTPRPPIPVPTLPPRRGGHSAKKCVCCELGALLVAQLLSGAAGASGTLPPSAEFHGAVSSGTGGEKSGSCVLCDATAPLRRTASSTAHSSVTSMRLAAPATAPYVPKRPDHVFGRSVDESRMNHTTALHASFFPRPGSACPCCEPPSSSSSSSSLSPSGALHFRVAEMHTFDATSFHCDACAASSRLPPIRPALSHSDILHIAPVRHTDDDAWLCALCPVCRRHDPSSSTSSSSAGSLSHYHAFCGPEASPSSHAASADGNWCHVILHAGGGGDSPLAHSHPFSAPLRRPSSTSTPLSARLMASATTEYRASFRHPFP